MPKMTLLEMVQNILSAMDSDEVNSINDTVESQQVAEVIKETYYDLFSDIYVPEHKGIIKLEGLGDLTRPNYLRVPENVSRFEWLKYKDSVTGRYLKLDFYNPEDFLTRILQSTSTSDNVSLVTDASGIEFYIKNNKQPSYYTVFDDRYLVCDSYDSAVDSTLQASKTFAWGYTEPTWTASDAFIPNLDAGNFAMLLSEAKSVCFINLKQVPNQKEEQRSRRHRVHFQYKKWKDASQERDQHTGVNFARNR